MGHIHLGVLPRTRTWRDVVDLLSGGAADGAVIAASARACERDLMQAAENPVFVETVRLLLVIPHAARSEDFAGAMRSAGLPVGPQPGLLDVVAAVSDTLDRRLAEQDARSDFAELSARALISTLSGAIGDRLPGLFDATPADVQAAARTLSWSKGIAELTRGFFGELVCGTLSYNLDRVLALHIGGDGRFADAEARGRFDVSLTRYSREATRIIQEFSGGWYGKTLHERGGISAADAHVFGAVAMKKIVSELRTRRGSDD